MLMLVDGNNFVNRAYQAISRGEKLECSADQIVESVLATIRGHLRASNPTPRVLAVFDGHGASTARRGIFPGYKAGRGERVPQIEEAIVALREQRHLMGSYRFDGREADDVIATAAHMAAANGTQVLILSSDLDMMQCIRPGVTVRIIGRSARDWSDWHPEKFVASWGFDPILIADYKALAGDKSDTIPGVNGIGPVYAKELLREIGDIPTIYANLWRVRRVVVKNLLEIGKDDALRFLRLTTLDRAVPELAEMGMAL